jgi:hypothetical protein
MTDTGIAERLERLERDNTRMKRLGVGALVLIAALGAIYAAQPVAEKVTAHEFEVLDAEGRLRATVNEDGIVLLDEHGIRRVTLGTPTPIRGVGPFLEIFDSQGRGTLMAAPEGIMLGGNDRGSALHIGIGGGESFLNLLDGQGFQMHLGSTEIVSPRTGETERTSAASIVMFGNDEKHRVIWKAP